MRDRRWAYYLGAGCLLGTAGIFLGPTYRRSLTEVVGITGVLLTYLRSRLLPGRQKRPWQTLSLSGVLFLLGGLIRVLQASADHGQVPYPSAADVLYLASYCMLVATAVLLVRLRSDSERDTGVSIDAMIVAASAAILEWLVAIGPYVHDGGIPQSQRIMSLVYAAVMLVLVGCTIRLAVGPGFRSVSFYLFAAGMWMTFLADIYASLAAASRANPSVSQSLGPFIFAFWGAAALHPGAVTLTEAPRENQEHLSWQRLTLLGTALLLVPSLTLTQLHTEGVDARSIVVGWVVLAVLVLVRMAELVRSKERTARNETILRKANGDLAAATSCAEMTTGALAAVESLTTNPPGFGAYIGLMRGSALETNRVIGSVPGQHIGKILPQRGPGWPLRLDRSTGDRTPPSHATRTHGRRDNLAHHTFTAPLVSQAELRGAVFVQTRKALAPDIRRAIEQLASTLSLALESAALTEDLHRERSERRFRLLVENSSDIVVVSDRQGLLTFASPACRHILGASESDVIGMATIDLVHSDDRGLAATVLDQVGHSAGKHLKPVEVRIMHADRSYRWFEIRARDMTNDQEVGGMVINAREISDRKAAEEEVNRREARFRALVQRSSDIVVVLDVDGTITYMSPAVQDALGYQPEELLGTPVLDLLDSAERAIVNRRTRELAQQSKRTGTFPSTSLELQVRHRDGTQRFIDTAVTDLRSEPAVDGIVLNVRDVTVRKALEHDLRHQALHDSLTGLGNRSMFLHHVNEALDHREPDLMVATLFIDLDDFKTVNDSLGHAVGDELLTLVAERLSTCLHHNDIAARLGGDEFALLVQTPYGRDEVSKLAERVLTALRSPFTVQKRDFTLAGSIGIAFEEPDCTAELLLRNADMAMYLAKERGKDRFEIFHEDMHATVFERLVLKADLASGIESGQLRLCYQPIVSLQTGRITGVEALVRWQHPTRGQLSPDQFVSLAEDTGLIVPLGHWVLEEACRQLRSWQLRLPSNATLTMSVNLSARQLLRDDIVDDIAATIHRFQLDPSTITMELTESMLMADTELSRRRLEELRTVGVSLAIDDFGTGYSSLGYVQQFPIDIIKIDRSFVDGLASESGNNPVVVQTMVELAQRLGVHIVAEGIENLAQLRALQALGCDLGQGYFFSRPVCGEEISPLLAASIEDGSQLLLHEPHMSEGPGGIGTK